MLPQDLLCKVQDSISSSDIGQGYVSSQAVVVSITGVCGSWWELVGVGGSVIQSTCQASLYLDMQKSDPIASKVLEQVCVY